MKNTLIKPKFLSLRGTCRWLATGVVASWLGVVGLPAVPSLSGLPFTTQAAIAQSDITNAEITQYAQAVLTIDGYRNAAYTEIKDILLTVEMDINDVNVSCSNTQNISEVPRSVRRDVREILTAYCNQSQNAVEANDLTPRRFNEITDAHEADATVYERIQQELIRLQQNQ
ncbi:MAG: DUF4168 domain-containing protein [Cyanobacteria bacterium J06626_4]